MSRSEIDKKTYLGDGVYSTYDGHHIILTTENGFRVTNEILLEPEVILGLKAHIKRSSLYRSLRRNDAGVIRQEEVDYMNMGLNDNGWDK